MSPDGTIVVFDSNASDLVANDVNGTTDVFVRDRAAGTTAIADLDTNGVQAPYGAVDGSVSADGRYVTFESFSALDPADTNEITDVYVRDLVAHTTTRVSLASNGGQLSGTAAQFAQISADGRFVSFETDAPELVPPLGGTSNPGAGNNGIFVRDRVSGTTTRMDVSPQGDPNDQHGSGTQSASVGMSPNGRFVVFDSEGSNLVAGGTADLCVFISFPFGPHGPPVPVSVACQNVFVRDRDPDGNGVFDEGNDVTTLASADTSGSQANGPSVSFTVSDLGDVAMYTGAANLGADGNQFPDVVVHDHNGVTTLIGRDAESGPAISADGRFVAFDGLTANGVGDDTNSSFDVFVFDRQTSSLQRASVASDGSQFPWASHTPAISGGGRFVTFHSDDDGSQQFIQNVFLRDTSPASDSDGVPASVEAGAPNGGDGNADGIADAQQDNVTSLPNAVDGSYVTVATPSGSSLVNVGSAPVPGAPAPPLGVSFPIGLLSFEVHGVTPGSTVQTRVFLAGAARPDTFWKLQNGAYVQVTNATVAGNVVTLTLTDGGPFDADGAPNGVIVDPIGLGSRPKCVLCVLDPSVSGALSVGGNAQVKVNHGGVVVNSSSAQAAQLSGNAKVAASSIAGPAAPGGFKKTGNATYSPTPTHTPAAADPLSGLAMCPSAGTVCPTNSTANVNVSGNSSLTIGPGVYQSIQASGNSKLTLRPGTYVVKAGLSAALNASITGTGVTIYLACSAYPSSCSPSQSGASLNVSGNAVVKLVAPASGAFTGLALFADRNNASTSVIAGNADQITGAFYQRAGGLQLGTNAAVTSTIEVTGRLQLTSNATLTISGT